MGNQEIMNLNNAFKNFDIAFDELISAICSACRQVFKIVKEIIEGQKRKTAQRQKFSLDLKRPFVIHQVSNRKPKHMIRKIIR